MEYIECENCNGYGHILKAVLYPTGHHEINETCTECDGEGEILVEKPNYQIY